MTAIERIGRGQNGPIEVVSVYLYSFRIQDIPGSSSFLEMFETFSCYSFGFFMEFVSIWVLGVLF